MTYTEDNWRLLTTDYDYRLLATSDYYRQLLKTINNYWRLLLILVIAYDYWWLLNTTDDYWNLQLKTTDYWQVQKHKHEGKSTLLGNGKVLLDCDEFSISFKNPGFLWVRRKGFGKKECTAVTLRPLHCPVILYGRYLLSPWNFLKIYCV